MLTAIIFNDAGACVKTLSTESTYQELKSYFEEDVEASKAYIVSTNINISGDMAVIDGALYMGKMEIADKEVICVTPFDQQKYNQPGVVLTPEIWARVNANVKHLYDGGSMETVPFPTNDESPVIQPTLSFVATRPISFDCVKTREQLLAL